MKERALRELLDKQEIAEVLARYCRGVDRCDEETLKSVYHPDAWDHHGDFQGLGHDLAETAPETIPRWWTGSTHTVSNILIEFADEDTAHSECVYMALQVMKHDGSGSGEPRLHVMSGRYIDRFERRNGEWRVADRVCVHDWSVALPFSAPPKQVFSHIQGERDRNDLVFKGLSGLDDAVTRSREARSRKGT